MSNQTVKYIFFANVINIIVSKTINTTCSLDGNFELILPNDLWFIFYHKNILML